MADVQIYTRANCSYCDHAKHLLSAKGVVYEEIRVDQTPGALEAMQELTSGRTFPQIIIKGKAIGGFDDLKALQDAGQLDALLG